MDQADRRYVVMRTSDDHTNDPVYWTPIAEYLKRTDVRRAILTYLARKDISGWVAAYIPATQARSNAISLNQPPTVQFLYALAIDGAGDYDVSRASPAEKMTIPNVNLYQKYITWLSRNNPSAKPDSSRKFSLDTTDYVGVGKAARVGQTTCKAIIFSRNDLAVALNIPLDTLIDNSGTNREI